MYIHTHTLSFSHPAYASVLLLVLWVCPAYVLCCLTQNSHSFLWKRYTPECTKSRTQTPRYNFKFNQNHNLDSYREIPRNLGLVDFEDVAFSVKSVIGRTQYTSGEKYQKMESGEKLKKKKSGVGRSTRRCIVVYRGWEGCLIFRGHFPQKSPRNGPYFV